MNLQYFFFQPYRFYLPVLILFVLQTCVPTTQTPPQKNEPALFELISPQSSGVTFSNTLKESTEFNIFKYLYFYNGAGVAAGDLNGDGLPDLYFTANQGLNKVYLNQGNFKFKDITESSGAAGDAEGWKTGVSMADVNGDGKLDIYVCQLGNYEGIFGKNQLFINQGNDAAGIPQFEDKAVDYGLDLIGFSTEAAFFDYDLDGDLDMYMLNHSVHSNGTFGKRASIRKQKHKLAGDKLMRNDGGKFTDVTDASGIYNSPQGYGLDVSFGDINQDGYPDIYVGNDFHENDYLYINQKDGTFKEVIEEVLAHTSRFSMGNDIGDINNDGLPDIISLDMLPEDPVILKASAAEDVYDVYHYKLAYGYNHQFSRNTLQLNQGNLKFSEIGLFSGVYATDWSWSALMADFDLDGYQDIFISNGIKRRSNDLDYIKYISNDAIQMRLTGNMEEKDLKLTEKLPVVKLPNYLYRNEGNLRFSNKAADWGLNQPSFSSGAIYADLDNDGDLDLITNNTDDPAFIYKNRSRELDKNKHYLKIRFQGEGANTQGIGARILTETSYGKLNREMYTAKGFQSSVPAEMVLGLGKDQVLKSLTVIWPDHRFEVLQNVKADQLLVLDQKNAKGKYEFKSTSTASENSILTDVSEQFEINYIHKENKFVEFNREPLIPHMVSAEGPALAVADVNGDGKDDFFVGGAKHQSGELYIQEGGKFAFKSNPAFQKDSVAEDVVAEFMDIDRDGDQDLLVLSGGNEFAGKSEHIRPRLYLNDGKGNFSRDSKAFKDIYLNGGALAFADYDKDGDTDVFLGARSVPWKYGINPRSYLMINDGKGNFTPKSFPQLDSIGLVTDAKWGDVDGNSYPDLVIVGDWMPVTIFKNNQGQLTQEMLPESTGLWSSVDLSDLDQDSDLDILAGNLGLNSKLKASPKHPLKMYVDDFDANGSVEQLLYHWQGNADRLFMTKDELSKQLVELNKKYMGYQAFAEAKPEEIFEPARLQKADKKTAEELKTCLYRNEGKGNFKQTVLPDEVQFAPVWAILTDDLNSDGYKDMYLGGNLYEINIQMGRYDASFGNLLLGNKTGMFTNQALSTTGVYLNGQIRAMKLIQVDGKKMILVARNKDKLRFILVNSPAE
ncbi:MAG: VCBS repeat-containing protein [Microscillaceae bacterium]|nr:VCBS repeat-containing protein [Microscillaceae bacterium]